MSLILIVLLPFASAALMGLLYLGGVKRPHLLYTFIGIGTPVIVTVISMSVGYNLLQLDPAAVLHSHAYTWLHIDRFIIECAFMADRLSATMIAFITFIGTLIHIYASGYMRGDEGYGKFFAFFNFFLASMLLLVLAANPVMMFVGWELVGLASYLLIGYYHQKSENMAAANKAFIVNRVGDFGFIIALGLLFTALGSTGFDFSAIAKHLGSIDHFTLSAIGLLLFVGAMGKSAQLPLYVWLPDAMAGPTPVSALIHAATMVTAGVYMVARFSFLYSEIPHVGEFIAYVGIASALFAALIACFQSDIKKILAYSTMSQLGYMFVAVGLGAYSAGIFHVFTHAFFKALLFMGAGAVIIALHHEQNIFKMGGLRRRLPLVFATMLIATLAISGIAPFAGFFSKDAILNHAFFEGYFVIWGIGVLTAFLTAYYMFRLLFSVFFATESKKEQLRPLGKSMQYPLLLLAAGALLTGWLNAGSAYGGANWFSHMLNINESLHHDAPHSLEYMLGLLNTLAAIAGISLAHRQFFHAAYAPDPNDPLWRVIIGKFYIDELYERSIIHPLRWLSLFLHQTMDRVVFDGVIRSLILLYRYAAALFGSLQNGKVRYYALYILAGISMLSLSLLGTLEGH